MKGMYHLSENIENITSEETTGQVKVSWRFPNGQYVTLSFINLQQAELLDISPELVLPEEGVSGQFYSSGEIAHFINRIKQVPPAR